MAQNSFQLTQGAFVCSICLDLLKDPVTVPCGHNYCMNCLQSHWDSEEWKKIYSCPQCRTTSTTRPVLLKNTMLAFLVEELKKSQQKVGMPSDCLSHIQTNFAVDPLKNQKLVEPSSRPDEVMKMMEVSRQNIQQTIQDRERDVNLLQQEEDTINRSADKAVEDTKGIFTELICLMTQCHSEVTYQVRLQQETGLSKVKELQEKLRQEITELRKKDVEIQTLLQTQDNIQFLQAYPSLTALSQFSQSPTINSSTQRYFENVTAAVSALRDKLQDVLRGDWSNISQPAAEVDVSLPQPEPTTREEFFRYSCDITLDPNTAHDNLILSDGNRKVTCSIGVKSHPHHPDRFTEQFQVLSKEGLTGRCYWEVKWSDDVYVAIACKNISREGSGTESEFGHNNKSCALNLTRYGCDFWCLGVSTSVSGKPSRRIGVYLDHSAGILSFYSISETMTLLHRFKAIFNQPLYVGFGLSYTSTAEICKLT